MAGIIDFHSHYIPTEIAQHTAFFKVNWSDIDGQLKSMDHNGIEKALLFYPATDAHLNMGGWSNVCKIYNEKISEVVKKNNDRFIGAGILPMDEPDRFENELRRINSLGLSAISLASSYDGIYLDDERFYPIYTFAEKQHIVIHVHPQIINPISEERIKDPLLTPVLGYMLDVSMCIGKMMMSGTFKKFPNIKFIFAHYGGVIPFIKERFDNTYVMLRKRNFVNDIEKLPSQYFKNLYFDTSGSKSLGSLSCALEVVDADHILYGSDYPANQNIPLSIKVINDSLLSTEKKQRILKQNALELFSEIKQNLA